MGKRDDECTAEVREFVVGFARVVETTEDRLVAQLSLLVKELPVTQDRANRDLCLRRLYQWVPDIPENWLCRAFDLAWDEYQAIVECFFEETSCVDCHEPIAMFMKDRNDRDRVWGLGISCEECTRKRTEESVQRYRAERQAELDSRAELLKTMPYTEYLLTPEWQARRRVALEVAGNRCQACNGPRRLDVHHRTYERRGCELPDDLTVLCRPCHQVFHESRRITRID